MDVQEYLLFRKGVLEHALECKKTGRYLSGFQNETIEQIEARLHEITILEKAELI